jgi:hypothetical protein
MSNIAQIRKSADDETAMELIREHLTEFKSEPTDADCLRYALKITKDYLQGKPKPRSPRKH